MTGSSLRRQPGLAVVETRNRVVLLRLWALSEPPIVLIDTAAQIWRLIDGDRDVAALVADLTSHLEIEQSVVGEDVTDFIGGLLEAGLVTECST